MTDPLNKTPVQSTDTNDQDDQDDKELEREIQKGELLSSTIDLVIALRTMAKEQGVNVLTCRGASTSLYELLVDRYLKEDVCTMDC